MKIPRFSVLFACFCMLLPLTGCRYEDSFEPNNTIEQATPLKAGVEVSARAIQGDPDIFFIEAAAGKTVVFKLRSLGLENCPEFAVFDPGGRPLYQDKEGFCNDARQAQIQLPGVATVGDRSASYEFRVPTSVAGRYFLRVQERRQADNMLPYSWDYALTAVTE